MVRLVLPLAGIVSTRNICGGGAGARGMLTAPKRISGGGDALVGVDLDGGCFVPGGLVALECCGAVG